MSKKIPDYQTELRYAQKAVNHCQSVIEAIEARDEGQSEELSFFQRELQYAHARLSRLKVFMGTESEGTEAEDSEGTETEEPAEAIDATSKPKRRKKRKKKKIAATEK